MTTSDPTPTEEDDAAGVSAKLDEVSSQLAAMHRTLKEENVKRDKRIRTNQLAIVAAIAVAAVGVIVGAFGVKEVHESNDRTTEARVAACKQFNVQQDQIIRSEIAQSHDFVDALTLGRADLEEVKRAFNDRHDLLIREGHPKRDCSPKGIQEYLEQQQAG